MINKKSLFVAFLSFMLLFFVLPNLKNTAYAKNGKEIYNIVQQVAKITKNEAECIEFWIQNDNIHSRSIRSVDDTYVGKYELGILAAHIRLLKAYKEVYGKAYDLSRNIASANNNALKNKKDNALKNKKDDALKNKKDNALKNKKTKELIEKLNNFENELIYPSYKELKNVCKQIINLIDVIISNLDNNDPCQKAGENALKAAMDAMKEVKNAKRAKSVF